MTADNLDNEAEIFTGMVATWAISSLKLFLLAIISCSSSSFALMQVANSAILFDMILLDTKGKTIQHNPSVICSDWGKETEHCCDLCDRKAGLTLTRKSYNMASGAGEKGSIHKHIPGRLLEHLISLHRTKLSWTRTDNKNHNTKATHLQQVLTSDTLQIDPKASPRKPYVVSLSRSSEELIFEV